MDFFNSRAGMESYFDSVLNNNYKEIKAKRKYSYGKNAIKSYIVESHSLAHEDDYDNRLKFILERSREVSLKAKLKETEEQSLVFLDTGDADFFVDMSDKRYIVLHTADATKNADPFIKKFYNAKGYDSLWLPVPLLLQTAEFGRFWGMGVSFTESMETPLQEEDWVPDEVQEQDVSLNIQRHFAKRFFDVLMNSPLNRMMGIARVSVLRSSDESVAGTENSFIIDDIKYNGKLTAKGTSFSRHARILYELLNMYRGVIDRFEAASMSFDQGYLTGSPTTIRFSREVDPKKLLDIIFSAEEPFRLWGIDEEVSGHYHRVYAVDMHHGNPGNTLTVEVTPTFIRVATPKNACGNTLLRLFSNVNHYVDAMATLEVSGYELRVHLPGTRLS